MNSMCVLVLDKNLKPWLRIPFIYKMSSISTKEKHCLGVLKGFSNQVHLFLIFGISYESFASKVINIKNCIQVIQARKLERSQMKKAQTSQIEAESTRSTTESSGIYGKLNILNRKIFKQRKCKLICRMTGGLVNRRIL